MITLILINGIRDVLKEIIIVKNGIYILFQMSNWKAFCQDSLLSYNAGTHKDPKYWGSLGCKKGRQKGRGKGRKEYKKTKIIFLL